MAAPLVFRCRHCGAMNRIALLAPGREPVCGKCKALEWVRRCPDPMPGEESEIEIRPVFEPEDFGEEFTPELRAQAERVHAEASRQRKG